MRIIALAGLLLAAVTVEAAQSSCDDYLPHALSFAVPRTALTEEVAAKLPKTLASLVQPMYVDPCGKGKALQINLAFGSDYEVIDWLERGRVDGGIVPPFTSASASPRAGASRASASASRSSRQPPLQPRKQIADDLRARRRDLV
jgi:ABC-type phosphate/phosphonate transport system substrate-binding protein